MSLGLLSRLSLFPQLALLLICLLPITAVAADSNFKQLLWPWLVDAVPAMLKSQDANTGRWGSGPIVVTEQNNIYPLAVAWATERDDNRYYHDPAVLNAIMRGGDFLISQQKPDGQWVFRKKDGSTWGDIYMPWTYSRWIRAFALIRDAMPADRRAKWAAALHLGFTGISRTALLPKVENICAHDAMALYLAGKVFNRPDWSTQARAYMKKVVAAQNPGGFWSENVGPVVNYNFVYMDAVGTYYGMSHDPTVLPALQRGAEFHANFTYPDGRCVETVDERNAYSAAIDMPNVGFTFSPTGRAYIMQQYQLKRKHHQAISPDEAASYILYAEDGPVGQTTAQTDHRFILGKNKAMVVRQTPWFLCLSAYHAPVPQSRWIMDRQNFVSLFHDKTGLILGGGNTKLTPLWSTFTAGNPGLLSHHKGETDPSYAEPAGLLHVPANLTLDVRNCALLADYASAHCRVVVRMIDSHLATVTYSLLNDSDLPIEAHATFIPKLHKRWSTAAGIGGILDQTPIHLSASQAGGSFFHHGWRIDIPPGATLDWPVLPYDQYVQDGAAALNEGRIVLIIPLGRTPTTRVIRIHIQKDVK